MSQMNVVCLYLLFIKNSNISMIWLSTGFKEEPELFQVNIHVTLIDKARD